jgi:uncharacterized protein YjdB
MNRIVGIVAITAVVTLGVGSALAADPMKDKEASPTLSERLTKDAVTGTLMKIDGEQYVVRDKDGKLIRMHVDKSTKLDKVIEGDKVKAYVTEDGHTTTLQRQEK